MRNLRKVVALVLAFAMVLSMSSVSFAADMTAAEKAVTLKVLKGDSEAGVTAEYLAKTPTRLQAAITSLRLQGLEDEALAYEGMMSFMDADDVMWAGGKAILTYLKANPAAGWAGYPDGSFKPNQAISSQEYVKVLLEALGYVQGVDFEWADVFAFAASMGLDDIDADTVMTNEQLAVGMVEALAATTADGVVLIDKLVADGAIAEADAIAAGLVLEVKDFALVSAETYGLRAVMFTFASDIDDDETILVEEDSDNFAIDKTVVDGNVLVATFTATADQMEEVEFTVSATGLDAIEVDEDVVDVVMADKVDPELLSVTVDNAKTFVVKYSEPIDEDSYESGTAVFDDVKLDDAKLVGKVEASDDMTELTYTLNEAVAANTYTFTMEDVADFAGFVAPSEVVTVTVIADDAAPALVSVEATDLETVVLTFDEDVADIGTVTIDGIDYTITDADIDGDEVTVDLTTALVASDAFVAVKGEYSAVEDVIENVSGDEIEFSFKAPFDDEAPTVSLMVTEENYIAVIFSEDVTGFDVTDVTIEDEDGDELANAFAINTDETDSADYEDEDNEDNIFLIELDALDSNVNGAEYTVSIDGDDIIDGSVLENSVADYEAVVTLFDIKDPSVVGTVSVIDKDGVDETLRVSFDEVMDEDTLEGVSNYVLGGAPLKEEDYKITVADDAKSVDILVEDFDLSASTLLMYGLEDVEGNSLSSYVGTIIDADLSFGDVTYELTDVDTIELTSAGHEFVVADPDDFEIYVGGVELVTLYVTNAVVDADDADVIVLSLSDDLNPDVTTDNGLALTIKVVKGDTVDTNDVPLVQAATAIADGVSATAEADGASDSITLTFDEELTAASLLLAASDIIVRDEDADVIAVTIDDDLVDGVTVITITGTDLTVDEDTDFTVELFSRFLEDSDFNIVNALAEVEVTVED